MKAWLAFFKKEWMESACTGKLLGLGILFAVFGVMNPAVAKLTPWLVDLLSEELAEGGMTVAAVEVNALTFWTQFYKNMPMALIVFMILYRGIFTREYESGTLVLLLAKGFSRAKVVLAKSALLLLLWTAGYWLCFGITYAYNAFYWDNAIAKGLGVAALYWWLFGVLIVSLMVLFSTLCRGAGGVLLGTGGVVAVSYLAGLLPACRECVPTALTGGMAILDGSVPAEDRLAAVVVAVGLSFLAQVAAVPLMNRRAI